MRNKLRLGIGAGLAASAVLALAGCSNSGSGGSGVSGVTGDGGSVNGSTISLVADAMNKANSAGTVKVTGTVTGSGVSMTLNADEQYSPSLEMSMSMQDAGQNITEILIGDKIYMDYPALASELGGGKQWDEIDLSEAGGSLGDLSSIISSARNENPTTQISALLASKEISKVGTETVQGQQTTHYTGTLNADDILDNSAQNSQLSSSQIASLKSMLQSGQVSSEKVDLWVASNGLPVQIKVAVQAATEGTVDMTMDMSDWGAPVNVSAPPAGEVADITSEISAAMASASASAG